MPRRERASSPKQRQRRGKDDERERESQGENGAVHATGGVVATWRTRCELTSRTNGDVQTPRVGTRGITGEPLPTDAVSIRFLNRLKLDLWLRLSPNLIDGFAS